MFNKQNLAHFKNIKNILFKNYNTISTQPCSFIPIQTSELVYFMHKNNFHNLNDMFNNGL